MTETEWFTSTRPSDLAAALPERLSERKARLFRCACRGVVWRTILEERHATTSGAPLASLAEFYSAFGDDGLEGLFEIHWPWPFDRSKESPGLWDWVRWITYGDRFGELVAAVMRDVWENPFSPTSFEARWRTATVVSLAQHVFDRRDFSTLPVLADALQDAGCGCVALLAHLRGPGPHVRGCWALDRVLGLN